MLWFSSWHVWVGQLHHKERRVLKNWCFWTVVLNKTLESPLDCKEIQPVNGKGNQFWIFIGRTESEPEAPILWPTGVKNRIIRKDLVAGKDWRQEEKRTTENEMVGWHHWLDGHEFEQALGFGEGQGGMACYSPWGCKELKMTERLNWIGHTPWQILFVIGMFIQQDWGSLRPQHLSPVMSLPMNRSQCLAFTRHSVSADCSGTSILVDIEEQRTHLSSCLK